MVLYCVQDLFLQLNKCIKQYDSNEAANIMLAGSEGVYLESVL
jgi:hypothetical protein